MGLLNWLFGRSDSTNRVVKPTAPALIGDPTSRVPTGMVARLDGPGEFAIEVVGESHYQAALLRICRGHTEEGHDLRVRAQLVLEDNNPFDSNAVRVAIDGDTVGHLSRRHAVQYRNALREAGFPNTNAYCAAAIRGGWDRGDSDVGHFGVRLDLPIAGAESAQIPESCIRAPSDAFEIVGSGHFSADAVWEQQFQDELRRLFKRRIPDDERLEVIAVLFPDDFSERPDAVRVEIGGLQVGYLNARSAKQVRRLLADAGRPGGPASCKAAVTGGWGEGTSGSFAVTLDIPATPRK